MASKVVADAFISTSASAKTGFYGATPIVQPAATAQSALASTVITTTGGDSTVLVAVVARVEAIRVLVTQMRTDLVNLGLIKGSA